MTKKFTIQTTGMFTLLVAFCLFASSVTAQTIIFEEQFDGGLPADWTVNAVTSGVADSVQNAVWVWTLEGTSQGAFAGATPPPIMSPSAANGSMMFDSDFLDNGGLPNNFGNGPAPSPHLSELISPVYDLTDHPNVGVAFYQHYRNFQTDCFIEVSVDGGNTWNQYLVNEDVPVNDATPQDDYQLVSIAGFAGGASSVQVKFVFSGDYYFWKIDDFAIVELPAYNLEVPRVALTNLFSTPVTQRTTTILDAEVCNNNGAFAQSNVNLSCAITAQSGAPVWDANFTQPEELGRDSCGLYEIPFLFDMEELDMQTGVYNMEYTASNDSVYATTDNIFTHQFEITDNVIQKGPFEPNGNEAAAVAAGGSIEWGYQFFIPNAGDIATSVRFKMESGTDEVLDGMAVTVRIYEIGPEPLAGDATTDNLSTVGFASHTYAAPFNNDFDAITVDLVDGIGSADGVPLNANTYYGVTVGYSGELSPQIGFTRAIDYSYTARQDQILILGDGDDISGFAGGIIPTIDVFLTPDPALANEEVVTSFNSSLFPNPADKNLLLELNLEEATKNLNIQITDAFGRLVEERNFENIQNETISFDTEKYASGSYLMFLRSNNQVQSKKFVITH